MKNTGKTIIVLTLLLVIAGSVNASWTFVENATSTGYTDGGWAPQLPGYLYWNWTSTGYQTANIQVKHSNLPVYNISILANDSCWNASILQIRAATQAEASAYTVESYFQCKNSTGGWKNIGTTQTGSSIGASGGITANDPPTLFDDGNYSTFNTYQNGVGQWGSACTITNCYLSYVYEAALYGYTNSAPNITSSNFTSFNYGQQTNITANISDADNDTISWVNFTVTAPNGTNTSYAGVNLSQFYWVTNASFTTTNGTYQVLVQANDGINTTSSSYNVSINAPPQFVAKNVSSQYYADIAYIYANLSDAENNTLNYVNFTVTGPNGTTIVNANGTNVTPYDWVSSNFTLTNGTYQVTITASDGQITSTSFNFTVTDVWSLNPTSYTYTGNVGVAQNFSFNVSHNSNQNFNYSFTSNCDVSNVTLAFSANILVGQNQNASNNGTLTPLVAGSYNCQINATRTYDNSTTQFQLYVNANVSMAALYMFDSDNATQCYGTGCDIFNTMTEATTINSSPTWFIKNTGNYAATNCSLSVAFTGGTFVVPSASNFNISVGGSLELYNTYVAPSAGSYAGYVSVSCIGDASNNTVSVALANKPYAQLTVNAVPVVPNPGGGSGAITTIQSVVAQTNISGNCNYDGTCQIQNGEDIYTCGQDSILSVNGEQRRGDCKPFDFGQFLCLDKTQPCKANTVFRYLTYAAIAFLVILIINKTGKKGG